MSTLHYSGVLVVEHCWCGIAHAIPQELRREAIDNGKPVYCPLGHSWVFKETRADQLERALAQERRRHEGTRELLEHEGRSHAATKGHLTRRRKRVAAGVCPCCGRSFQQLARHMKAKHPDYAGGAS